MTENNTITDFNLDPALQKSIADIGYKSWTPIQERCLPVILKGQDVAGLAQTGTGKTAAFLIPLIDRVLKSQKNDTERSFKDWNDKSFVLILVPTRELVSQVYENLQNLTKGTSLGSVFLYGGVGYEEQLSSLKKPFQFIVATPGRLIDLYKENHLDLKQVRAAVFDEADRMFDMGFQQDVLYVLRRIPEDRQLLLFSATLNLTVTQMAYQANSNPVEIDVSRDQVSAGNVDDKMFHLATDEKPKFLLSILKKYAPKQVIIFSNFKNKVPRVADFLSDNGYPALGISSLLSQAQRNRVIDRFKQQNNQHNILVATDVAARGLDIKGVDLVINYELPEDAENYVHRIGRTGRADQKGQAISLVSDKDVESMMRIEEYLKEKVEVVWFEESELVSDFKPMAHDDFRRDGHLKRRERPQEARGPRGPRRDGPSGRSQNSHQRRPTQENGEARGEGNSVHRDKRSGRHRDQEDARRNGGNSQPRQDRSKNPNQKNAQSPSQGKKPFQKNQNRYQRNETSQRPHRGSAAKSAHRAPPKTQSLWGKITSSVKRWIG